MSTLLAAAGVLAAVLVGAAAGAAWAWRRRGSISPSGPALAPIASSAGDGHRELLASVVDDAPSATLVLDEAGRVVYASHAAARLFFGGAVPPDASLSELVRRAPASVRRALSADRTELVVVPGDDDREVYQVTKRTVRTPAGHLATVVSAHPLTDEILREEVAAYKKLVRVLAHELNNSLAPVASLAATGQHLATRDPTELGPLLATIAERVEHLRTFLGQYAALARLPQPRRREVAVAALVARVAGLYPGVRVIGAPVVAWADEAQLEQLLVNLVKNAIEAGSLAAEVELDADVRADGQLSLAVRDRGGGLSDEVLASALVPFFSTKPGGSGLGLAISREIVEAHGGRLRLRNRDGGGAEAVVRIPGRGGPVAAPVSWTFTRP